MTWTSPAVEWIREIERTARRQGRVTGLAAALAAIQQLREGLITAPEQRVADEAITEVKRLLEEQ